MPWSAFSKELKEAIAARGFSSPTDIQVQGTPPIHMGKNTLLIAPTGLGKTESVLLPVWDHWLLEHGSPFSILYITPMKSLNRDLLSRIMWWSQKLGFEVSVRHGDTTQYERSMQAANPSDMLISTPETLQAVLVGSIMRRHISNVKWIIIDEVHEIVSSKRGVQLAVALERLKNLIAEAGGRKPQIIGLSATVGSPEKVASFLTAGGECEIVNTVKVRKMNLKVESPNPKPEDYSKSPDMFLGPQTLARVRRILELIKEKNSVLTFTNTRESAEVLSSRLKVLDKDIKIETHHSSLSKDVRVEAEESFRNRKIKSLVCTSSLELGIDIGSIDFILQFMSPRQVTKLLQRVGRSGHTASGVSDGVIISSDPDDIFESTAIAELALKGWIEPTQVYTKSLDVLAHQIVGLALEEYNIEFSKAFSIIKKSFPFHSLTEAEFMEVCQLLQKLGFIWLSDRRGRDESPSEKLYLRRRKRSWEYYYRNLSTIPDVKNFRVFDTLSSKVVGSLDAEFMAMHGSPGTAFIMKGRSWRILEVGRGKVFVEPTPGIEAAIPAWEGELIPIPSRVAQDVGMLRKEIAQRIKAKETGPKVADWLLQKYPVARDAAKKLYASVKKQAEFGFVPDSENILIEHYQSEGVTAVIFHTCFGSLINETLGRVLSTLLSNTMGSVGLQVDPYRIVIIIQTPKWDEVVEQFRGLKPKEIEPLLSVTLPNTELFHWRFLHVAQRFGIIARDADFGKGYLRKIMEVYSKTPAFGEALHEVFEEKLDIPGARKVLEQIAGGEIKMKTMQGLSYMGRLGLMKKYELVAPERPEQEIFKIFRERLMGTKIRLVCAACGWGINYLVKDLPQEIRCSNCKAKLMAVMGHHENEKDMLLRKYVRDKKLEREEMEIVNSLMDTASLVVGSGRDAVITLAGRGIGPKSAARILAKQLTGDELLKEILKNEQQYARTKRFWRD